MHANGATFTVTSTAREIVRPPSVEQLKSRLDRRFWPPAVQRLETCDPNLIVGFGREHASRSGEVRTGDYCWLANNPTRNHQQPVYASLETIGPQGPVSRATRQRRLASGFKVCKSTRYLI